MKQQQNNWLALIALALAMLVIGLDATVLNVALPTIAEDLHATTSQLQWVINTYVLALAGAMLPAGVLGDRYGRKRVLQIGLAIFLLGSLGCAMTTSIDTLIALRVFMGLGAAIVMPIVMALIPIMFNDDDRPKAVAALAASVSLGVPLGPIIGGYLLKHYVWHSIFWINVPVIILAMIATAILIAESRAPRAPRLDIAGALLSIAGIVMLVYGFVEAPSHGWTAASTIGWLGGGAVLLIAFVVWQTRAPSPLVDLSLFRDRRFSGGTLSMALLQFVLYGLLFTLPLYLQGVRGNDAFGTGLRLVPMMAGILIAAAASKPIIKQIGASLGTVIGMVVTAVDLLLLSRLTPETGMVWIGLGLAGFGLGAGVAMTSAMDAVLGSLPDDAAGAGSAVMNTIRQLAGALGVAILGSILYSAYKSGLDPAVLAHLTAPAAQAVKGSIMGAVTVAGKLGAAGAALERTAADSYTHAMAILLIISGVAGIAAAIVAGLIIPGKARATVEEPPKPSTTAAREQI